MTRKPTKLETLKQPRTVQELTPWLNDQLGEIRDLVQQVAIASSATAPPAAPCQPAALHDPVGALLAHLREALVHWEAIVTAERSPPPAKIASPNLARALLLTGNGAKFEPCIQAAIREYCDARQEALRCARQTRVPEEVRDDLLAGWNRVLANRKQDLRLLGVTMEEVAVGAPLDLSRHQVVEKLAAQRSEHLHTVRLCITPVLTWKNLENIERWEPARVAAYTELTVPERERSGKTGNSSPGKLFHPSKAFSPFDHP